MLVVRDSVAELSSAKFDLELDHLGEVEDNAAIGAAMSGQVQRYVGTSWIHHIGSAPV